MAAVFGSSVLTTWRLTVRQLNEHRLGIRHFAATARNLGVDVELQNHPLYDGMWDKTARLPLRTPGQPHPHVVSPLVYDQFLQVMGECMKAALAKRGATTD
jgi:hypothetical protein